MKDENLEGTADAAAPDITTKTEWGGFLKERARRLPNILLLQFCTFLFNYA